MDTEQDADDGIGAADADLLLILELIGSLDSEEGVRDYPMMCEPRRPSWRGLLGQWSSIIARKNRSCVPLRKAMLLWKHVAVVDGVACVWLAPNGTGHVDHKHLACIRGPSATILPTNAGNDQYRREIMTEMDPESRQKSLIAFLERSWATIGSNNRVGFETLMRWVRVNMARCCTWYFLPSNSFQAVQCPSVSD